MVKSKKIWLLIFLVILSEFILVKPTLATTASLYVSPAIGTSMLGDNFSVSIIIDASGGEINAAEGTVIFNPVNIEVVSLDKSASIFTLWTTEPTFSNSTGKIIFGGGSPSGFKGAGGVILNITLKSKAVGSFQLIFSSGSVLAADGQGTNVLASLGNGRYIVSADVISPSLGELLAKAKTTTQAPAVTAPSVTAPAVSGQAPATPVVSSPTHPEPDQWYSNNNPYFAWELPSDVTGVSLLLHKSPTANPGPVSDGLIASKKYEETEDGSWYFHIKFRNRFGWGSILHRKVLIDTQAPEPFKIAVDDEGDPTNPAPLLDFKTSDSLSGVEYYEVQIGEGEPVKISSQDMEANPYRTVLLSPSKHTILARAVDYAGNSTSAGANVIIKPIEAPIITTFSKSTTARKPLTIEGSSLYPNSTVSVFIKKEGEEKIISKEVKTDSEGIWSFVYEEVLGKGVYQAWAEITDARGAKSLPTEKITITAQGVILPSIAKLIKIPLDYQTIMIYLIFVIIIAVLISLYFWRRISLGKKKIRKETKEAEESVRQAFKNLQEEVEKQIEYLDKKPGLTKREKEIRNKLQEALSNSEESISKEIKDIEEELE